MDTKEEEDDVKLERASASLLADLETNLPKLLWKSSRLGPGHGAAHSQVKQKDLDSIVNLIEPFQGEPQLLDAKLKAILPPIVEAYLESLARPSPAKPNKHLDIRTALSSILYTLCKVRGAKVIIGFFNNEPRYLEPVLSSLEAVSSPADGVEVEWKVPYVSLLWLSHLLLAPFDLASISTETTNVLEGHGLSLDGLPSITVRVLRIALQYLATSTKAQDAAASMLARLVIRPDMQKLRLGDALIEDSITRLRPDTDTPTTVYQQLGPLRFLAAVSASADLGHLIPSIYRACERLAGENSDAPVSSNAVGKRLIIKIFRNIAILSFRAVPVSGPLLSFLETTSVLEDVIDHLLRSLADRDTPVRYAAAKAISLTISGLDPGMGHEVIQAVLDTFKEDMPRGTPGQGVDYQRVNALKWHGLTLALSHALFKRSAAPEQLPDILEALVSALNFEQRTATGSSVGTNVRDAANFGIWSLSRRYTTEELLSFDASDLRFMTCQPAGFSHIQAVAIQLLLAACCDPAGNIRRGSSAALQELIGRHPNQVIEGISLVQIVDYQAVGLRRRGLVDVTARAAALDNVYWKALVDGLVGWRGLGSIDVSSREATAESLASLNLASTATVGRVEEPLMSEIMRMDNASDVELLHGIVLSMALILDSPIPRSQDTAIQRKYWNASCVARLPHMEFTSRVLKSELPSAMARLATAVCRREITNVDEHNAAVPEDLNVFVERLLARQDDSILRNVPDLVQQILQLERKAEAPLGSIDTGSLSKQVAADSAKAILHGAGRAIALGALASHYDGSLSGENAMLAITRLSDLITAMNVDWRVIGLRALHHSLSNTTQASLLDPEILRTLVRAINIGLNDYTVDERGDIGSLVRLQALTCATRILSLAILPTDNVCLQLLQGNILRLSLEKLDRVRARAALCRHEHLPPDISVSDADDCSSEAYIRSALLPLLNSSAPIWVHRSLLESCISSAGGGSENLLQTTRQVLAEYLTQLSPADLSLLLSLYTSVLRDLLPPTIAASATPTQLQQQTPALHLLTFLLSMNIPQRLTPTSSSDTPPTMPFKSLTLLSVVQKLHHKSTDIPKLLAAVDVYIGLADFPSIRAEVVKKLMSMAKTNPFPMVRGRVGEALWLIFVGDEELRKAMKCTDWSAKGGNGGDALAILAESAKQ